MVSPPKPTSNEDQELSYEEKKAIVWKKAHCAPGEEESTESSGKN